MCFNCFYYYLCAHNMKNKTSKCAFNLTYELRHAYILSIFNVGKTAVSDRVLNHSLYHNIITHKRRVRIG